MTQKTPDTIPTGMTPAQQALLARLTRKGARLVAERDHFVVQCPGDRARSDVARLVASPAEVAAAVAARWIASGETGAYRLTEAGAVALRRGLRSEPVPLVDQVSAAIRAPRSAQPGGLSPLARLRHKRDARGAAVLSGAQVEAGERFARDFHAGQMMPRVTANWDRAKLGFGAERGSGQPAVDVRDGVAGAQERVRRALEDAGPELAGILVDVCCFERGMEDVERQRQWPPRTARIVLGLALDRLMRHYGMIATGPARGTMSHWGDGSHKPTVERW